MSSRGAVCLGIILSALRWNRLHESGQRLKVNQLTLTKSADWPLEKVRYTSCTPVTEAGHEE
jgi:hypothetical protein